MTYYHDIVDVLRDSDEPLEAKDIADKIDGRSVRVYEVLKKMRENDAVIADRSLTNNGVRIYQLRRELI